MKPETKLVKGDRVRRKGFRGFWTVDVIDGEWISCTGKRDGENQVLRTQRDQLIPVGKQRTKGKRK